MAPWYHAHDCFWALMSAHCSMAQVHECSWLLLSAFHEQSRALMSTHWHSWAQISSQEQPWVYCYFCDIAAYFNSDFDAYHDSLKGEVTQNVLVKSNDVSDIFKHFVDEKGVSSCLKSLWKTTLCRFILCIWPPLNPVIDRRTISRCYEVLELTVLILQKTSRSWSSWYQSFLHHRPQEHPWHKLQDLHLKLGDREDGPFRGTSRSGWRDRRSGCWGK